MATIMANTFTNMIINTDIQFNDIIKNIDIIFWYYNLS